MSGLSLAIVGAGIGGLTSALTLARQGHTITLIERRTGFSEVGAGLQLSPNASRILIDLGLGPALRRVATEPDRVVIRSIRSGKNLGEVALGPFMRERFDAPYWVVHRADLQQILLDAVRSQSSIRLLTGRTVEDVKNGPASVALTLSTESGNRDVFVVEGVVGADGIWSKLRQTIRQAAPDYAGYVAWRGTVDRKRVPLELAGNETGLWLGRRGHVVHYPIAGGALVNIVVIERRAEPVKGWSVPGRRIKLLARYNEAATPLRELIAGPQEWLLSVAVRRPGATASPPAERPRRATRPIRCCRSWPRGRPSRSRIWRSSPGDRLGNGNPPGSLRAYGRQRLNRVRKVQRPRPPERPHLSPPRPGGSRPQLRHAPPRPRGHDGALCLALRVPATLRMSGEPGALSPPRSSLVGACAAVR